MGAAKERMMEDLGAAAEAASAVSGEVAATPASALPAFEWAIIEPSELPAMPAQVIEGVLLETHKMLLTGPSKAGKTWCLINLAISVATGGWWIDFRCARRKVLYVDLETDPRTLQRRLATVAKAKGVDAESVRSMLAVWPLRGRSCSLEEIALELFDRCRAGDFGMVIIDPAYMVQDGDENNARDIREFFARLDEICVRLACTVVISHHHSKGAQGLKSAIDRGSGSGVFGRAPDAVLDMTELVLEASTLEMARKSNRLAAIKHLTGWRMSFTLREFEHRDPIDLWFAFPLHEADATGLLGECKPNYGGPSESRRARVEAENLGKVTAIEAVIDRMLGDGEYVLREDVRKAIGWSEPTVKRWVDDSERFERCIDPRNGRASIRRVPRDVGATMGLSGGAADEGKGAQGEIPIV